MRRLVIGVLVAVGPLAVLAAELAVAEGARRGGVPAVAAWYLMQLVLPAAGGFGLAHAALVAWRLPRARPVAALTAVLAVPALVPGLILLGLWSPRYWIALEDASPAATVRLPLDGPVVVGWGGDTVDVNYHAATPDQRWAYDLLVEPAGHGSGDLAAYGCYGLPVLAPAAGRVGMAHDGEPDQDPSAYVPNLKAPAGNHVALVLEDGTWLLLGHLQPGSLAVAVGDTVAEGQVLGRCGNSGNTSEPHVHIHHVREEPVMIGFGEGLPLYFRDHDGPPMPQGGVRMEDGRAVFTGDRVQHRGG